jgi:hypothetical protein
MLGEQGVEESRFAASGAAVWRGRDRRLGSSVTALLAAGLVVAYALPGGTYDLVTRQEYGIVLWGVLGLGWASGVLPRSRPSRLVLILLGLLAAYAAWTALSLTWTQSAERTTVEVARVVHYVGLLALIASALDRGNWRAAAMGAGFGALLVCGLAVASRLTPAAFPGNALFQPRGTNRLSYPFGYWNAVGAWGAMSATIGLAWSAHDGVRWRRAIALGAVPLAVITTYLSYSRAGIAGTAVGAVFVLILSRNRMTAFLHALAAGLLSAVVIFSIRGAPEIAHGTGTRGTGSVLAAIVFAVVLGGAVAFVTGWLGVDGRRASGTVVRMAVIVGALVVAVAAVGFGPRVARKAWREFRHPTVVTTTDPTSRLTQLSGTRYAVWRSALHAFAHNPVSGTGAGTFAFWWDRDASDSEAVRNAHSFELENMAELGSPGLLLILGVMVGALVVLGSVRRRVRRSVSAGASVALLASFCVYLVQASVDWMWQVTAVTALALGGVAILGARLSQPRGQIQWYTRAVVSATAVIAVVIQLPGLLSTLELKNSQQAESAGNAALALAWANAAAGAEPWSASAYEQRGLVLEAAGRLDGASVDLQRAVSHERTNFRHWLILSRIETERGDFAAAVRDYEQARRLRPKALVFVYSPYFSGARAP